MRSIRKMAAALVAAAAIPATALPLAAIPATAHAAVLGGSFYAMQYDYREFYAVANGRPFRVELFGNPYPGLPMAEMARRLLPVLQANKPPPDLTFTYDAPAARPRPDYRLVLVFDAARNLDGGAICNGTTRFRPATAGRVSVFAVYCRDEQALSQVGGWTTSAAPDDAGMSDLVKDLFNVVFERSTSGVLQHGHGFVR
jgi:hypothetical protein